MSKKTVSKCEICYAKNECPEYVMEDSVICMMKRMGSKKTHGDVIKEQNEQKRCPHCGRRIN